MHSAVDRATFKLICSSVKRGGINKTIPIAIASCKKWQCTLHSATRKPSIPLGLTLLDPNLSPFIYKCSLVSVPVFFILGLRTSPQTPAGPSRQHRRVATTTVVSTFWTVDHVFFDSHSRSHFHRLPLPRRADFAYLTHDSSAAVLRCYATKREGKGRGKSP